MPRPGLRLTCAQERELTEVFQISRGRGVVGVLVLPGGDRKSNSHDASLILHDLGIDKDKSSRWQQVGHGDNSSVLLQRGLAWLDKWTLGRRERCRTGNMVLPVFWQT